MKATIYKSTGSWYVAKSECGKIYQARMKGILRIDGITSTNPIAVGDIVEMEIAEDEENIATISAILNRKNYVARVSPHNKRQHHIVASNLDQSVLIATLKEPKTSLGFIDRFLTVCEMFHVPAIIVLNKADLYRKKEQIQFERLKEIYTQIGYKVLLTSIVENKGLEELSAMLSNKTTLFSGHSGVGKSTFINYLLPDLMLRTQQVSDWSGKGLHTTTFAEMFDLPFGGRIVDTPGIRELAPADVSKQELSHYFPELRALIDGCQFNNCIHLNEPYCAVKQAVMDGLVSGERYISYCSILGSIDESITKY